jgi:hypothetical protein
MLGSALDDRDGVVEVAQRACHDEGSRGLADVIRWFALD